tara:strand:+ start:322 stop:618 length:297 start_codon:yes stop_codon:yes gene_type:complete
MENKDYKALNKCCDRVYKDSPSFGVSWLTKEYIYQTISMSLELAHKSLVKRGSKGIDFAELAETDDGTFYHDVWGCDRHVSRDYPNDLEGGFLPRICR